MATIIDLNQYAQSYINPTCDVCVIGAGAAGLYLSSRLSRKGLNVIILEAGAWTCGTGASVGIEPVFSRGQFLPTHRFRMSRRPPPE